MTQPDKIVVVTLEGGVIQDIDVPEGIVVQVMDFDVEDASPEELAQLPKNNEGEEYHLTTWSHADHEWTTRPALKDGDILVHDAKEES